MPSHCGLIWPLLTCAGGGGVGGGGLGGGGEGGLLSGGMFSYKDNNPIGSGSSPYDLT